MMSFFSSIFALHFVYCLLIELEELGWLSDQTVMNYLYHMTRHIVVLIAQQIAVFF